MQIRAIAPQPLKIIWQKSFGKDPSGPGLSQLPEMSREMSQETSDETDPELMLNEDGH